MDIFKYFIEGIKVVVSSVISICFHFLLGIYTLIISFPKYLIKLVTALFRKKSKRTIPNMNVKKFPVVIALSLCVYFICVFLGSKWYVQGLKIKYLSQDIMNSTNILENEEDDSDMIDSNTDSSENTTPASENNQSSPVYYPNDYWDYLNVPFLDVNFDELLSKNPDTVGWLKVDGTKVNYPVVQASDNDYYLKHAFNRSSNVGGWIFGDYRNDFENFDKNTIIYGHNMNNKTMFGSVPNMLYSSYLNNSKNYYIKLSTPKTNTVWKVFSIYTIKPEVYYLKTTFYSEKFEDFIKTLSSRSIYDFGVDVNVDDKILTLSTCDNTGTKRVAVHAKMINIEYK